MAGGWRNVNSVWVWWAGQWAECNGVWVGGQVSGRWVCMAAVPHVQGRARRAAVLPLQCCCWAGTLSPLLPQGQSWLGGMLPSLPCPTGPSTHSAAQQGTAPFPAPVFQVSTARTWAAWRRPSTQSPARSEVEKNEGPEGDQRLRARHDRKYLGGRGPAAASGALGWNFGGVFNNQGRVPLVSALGAGGHMDAE